MSQPDITGSAGALLMEALGLPLLSYLCAVDEVAMRDRLEGAGDLPASADSVLFGQLLPLAERVARAKAEHRGLPAAFALQPLGERTDTSPWGLGNLMRLEAGGAIPEQLITDVANDPVKKALAHMALDAYPVLLAPVDSDWEIPGLSMFRHPKRVDLSSALETDSDLSRLFPEEDPGLGRRGFIYTSLGRGGTCQSVMFGETVIQAAWYSATIRTARPTPQDLVETVLRFVDLLREAAAGGRPTVQSLIVFTGFITAGGKVVETPWGNSQAPNRPRTRCSSAVA